MESSQVVGAEPEKWSGSESGWTMYLGSPTPIHSQSNDVYQVSDHKEGGDERNHDKKAIPEYFDDDDDESDDSMASDASSGPIISHHELVLPCDVGEGEGGLRQAAKENQHGNYFKCSSGKKVGYRKLKKRYERSGIKEEKEEELLHKADSAGSHV